MTKVTHTGDIYHLLGRSAARLAGEIEGNRRARAGRGADFKGADQALGAGLHVGQAMPDAQGFVLGIEALAVVLYLQDDAIGSGV